MARMPSLYRVPLSVPGDGSAEFWRQWLAAWLRIGGAIDLPRTQDRERLHHLLRDVVCQQELRELATAGGT